MSFESSLHRVLAKRSFILDAIGRVGLRFYLYRENSHFDGEINGEYDFLDKLKTNGFSPKTILDVGANRGLWTDRVRAIWRESNVHLFDPVKSVADHLRARFASDDNCHIHQYAVGEADSFVNVHEDHEESAHSFVSIGGDETGESVKMVASGDLTTLIKNDKVDLMKIDAEGFDLTILRGMEKLLSTKTVDVIQFEHHGLTASYQISFGDIVDHLAKFNYRVGKIFPDGLREVHPGPTNWSQLIGPNFVAFSPNCEALFESLVTRK